MKKWLVLILLFSLWGYGLVQVWAMRPFKGQVFMHYRDAKAVEERMISDAVESEALRGGSAFPEITAWNLTEGVTVVNRELGVSKEADCIAVHGLKEMASYRRLLRGTYGYRTDREGCVISRELALKLFGGLDVTGKSVWCRDRPYIVRGVTDDASLTILVPAGRDDLMRYMLIDCVKDSSGKTEAEGFLSKYGIGRGESLVDGTVFFMAAGLAVVLPLWIVPAWMVLALSVKGADQRKKLKVYGLAAVFVLAGVCLIWGLELRIPSDLIPSRWSDFDFWTKKAEELHSDLDTMGEAGWVQWLVQLKRKLAVCTVCSLGNAAGLIIWVQRQIIR